MSVQPRRIQVSDLGEPALKLVHEMQESGEEVVLEENGRDIASVRPITETTEPEPCPEASRQEAVDLFWERFDEISKRITRNWTSPLTALEAVEEQRR